MQFCWFRDFLPSDLITEARAVALSNQHLFVPTTVSTNVPDYRRSSVLWHYHFVPLYTAVTAKIIAILPAVMNELNQHFDVGNIEVQMTSSGNSEFFKSHNDNGTPDTETRQLTFVWYFLLKEPKQFSGGELVLQAPHPITILPNHNSCVFFPSGLWHEVMPVKSSGKFEDSRLTLNGWVRTRTT